VIDGGLGSELRGHLRRRRHRRSGGGQLLRRLGHNFLDEVYGDRTLTTSLNALLGTLYHLFALGLLTLVALTNLGLDGIQLVIARTGISC
jgi:hypothetical protein